MKQASSDSGSRVAPVPRTEISKELLMIKKKGLCLFIYGNPIYLSSDCNDVKDWVPDKKSLSHET